MGKASRRKHANEQQRLYFDIKEDARSTADRARARATLDALQQKLVDDALREDGFYFVDGKYVDARRPRFTPGMKTQTFSGHTRRITHVAIVPMTVQASTSQDLNSFVVTFGIDCICVWNMKTGERLGVLDVKSHCAVSICGAATRPSSGSLLWIAFATHLQPNLVAFDPHSSPFQPHEEIVRTLDFGVGHQQQITCMAFTHSGDPMLATGSLDSTCIIWTLSVDDRRPTLKMRLMLPVTDTGVSACVFTSDDQALVSVGGDGTVEVWRVDGDSAKGSERLHQQHEKWQHATQFTLTIAHTRELLLFDDIPPSFHGNDEWLLHDRRCGLRKTDLLQAPLAGETLENGPEYLTMPPLQTCEREQNDGKPPDPSTPRRGEILSDDEAANRSDEEAVDVVERLRREYETMETFDFERLLNPAGLLLDGIGGEPKGLESIEWPLLTQDGHGRLLNTFTRRKKSGEYAGHTSHVADCAVAHESDLVVTVSFDKAVICWSISMGIVQSITREAHTAPITSCALTSPTTCQPKDLELLLATSGKDNLIKVWQFNKRGDSGGCLLECVYSLAGHYDAISALAFDASGVFLLSASDDTLAHCWRVRPAPPDAPIKPTVATIDRFAISIAWNMPLANGSALVKYVVHTEQLSSLASDGSDKKPVMDRDVEVKYKTATVDGLQPGIQYRLCVAAVNSVGQSQWSETTDVVETLAFAPSQIDKAVLYRDITATSVRLSWKAPCANGAPITSYTVKSLPENTLFARTMETPLSVSDLSIVIPDPEASRRRHAGKLKVKTTTATKKTELGPTVYEYVLGGLWPGEVYQFIVAAENRCGLGGFSPSSDYIKMESTAPDAPAKPQLTSVDKRQAEVMWIKPRNNGSEILQYIIEWTQETEHSQATEDGGHHPTSRTSVTMLTKSIVGTTYKIVGLRPGRPLRVWVAATNLVNGKLTASPFSEPSDAVCTLSDAPDPPKKPRIESPTPYSLVIAIDPPCDNGASIELYQIMLFSEELQFGIATKKIVREVTLTGDEFDATQQSDGMDRWRRFTAFKLRAKTFYSATVVARNALGWSQVSVSSVAVSTRPPIVPATILTAPQIRDVEPTQAKISWLTPSHDGGAALASMVLQYRINDGAFEHEIVLFQGSELVLEHLKPRTTYAFRVAASNAVGRAEFSPACEPFTTPSLVDFTISTYFASRPAIEHTKATVLQVLYCCRWALVSPSSEMDVLEERFAAAAASGSASLGAGAAASPGLHLPPPIARVSPGNIRSLILEKEKELHDINEYRIRTLETLLREKESAATAYKQKFSKLQEDFKYNLKLLEGRDEELALYDTNFAAIKSVVRDREAELSELKAQLADAQTDLKQEQKRASEQEAYYQQKLKDARAQMEGARWNFDDELRRVRDEMETSKRKMERQLREQQEELETQRREITITFDDAMRQRELEFKQTLDELQTKTRELELKLKSSQRECEMSKERADELKLKMENMQQLLNESEKEAKSMDWQLTDLRATKDAKIRELEDEIVALQDVKQSLLDEYEGKMAELLQSLHSVEKAFVQQKAQYEAELERHVRKKNDEAQDMTLRMDAKVQSLMAKVRSSEEQYEKLQAEMKQLTWESEDKLQEKDRELERLRQEVGDVNDQKQSMVAELKQQLWTVERENQGLQDKLKEATLQLQMQKEKDKMHRHELAETMEKQEDLKREIVTMNLRWENKYQEHENELNARHEARVRDLQHARERLMNEKQATDDRLLHAENELHRVRSELMTLKSDARISATFGSQFVSSKAERRSHDDGMGPPAASSPLWSDDNGTLSPITGMSPLLTDSPQRVVAERMSAGYTSGGSGMMVESLQAENAKLKDLIHQMRDALTQQANDLRNGSSPDKGDTADLINRLQLSEKQCVILQAKLQDAESRVAAAHGNSGAGSIALSEQLTLCQAELIQAKRLIEEKTKRIIELEKQIETMGKATQPGQHAAASAAMIASTEVAELKRKLASAHADIERLVKERTQLMELSNQLTAELRKLKATPPSGNSAGGVEFTGKKDYENMIADLSRSLEELRVHNKTLKKELRRMVKLHAMNAMGRDDGGDGEYGSRSRAPSMASTSGGAGGEDNRRRSSTLSMMRVLETHDSRRSTAVSSRPSAAPPASLFDEELLSLVRTKTPASSSAAILPRPQRHSTAAIPPSIPEDEEERDEGTGDELSRLRESTTDGQRPPSFVGNTEAKGDDRPTSLSMLFQRDRVESMDSATSSLSAPVSDARMRLQQAKEMLLLAGKKAERSASLASVAALMPSRSSERETPSQKSAIKKLKDLQTKRAEMVSDRKKVRNYSMAT